MECLQKLINENNYDNIKIFPYAISSKTGPTSFYHNENRTMSGLDLRLAKNKPSEIVMAITMDLMFETLGIAKADLVKFDVEGEESNIILSEGFKNVIQKCHLLWVNGTPGPYYQKTILRQNMKNLDMNLRGIKNQMLQFIRPSLKINIILWIKNQSLFLQ